MRTIRTDDGVTIANSDTDDEDLEKIDTGTLLSMFTSAVGQYQCLARIIGASGPCSLGIGCQVSVSVAAITRQIGRFLCNAMKEIERRSAEDKKIPISGFRMLMKECEKVGVGHMNMEEDGEKNAEVEEEPKEGKDEVHQKTWKFNVN